MEMGVGMPPTRFVLQLVAYAIDKDVLEAKVMIEESLGMPLS